jgi:hypothetical protein
MKTICVRVKNKNYPEDNRKIFKFCNIHLNIHDWEFNYTHDKEYIDFTFYNVEENFIMLFKLIWG